MFPLRGDPTFLDLDRQDEGCILAPGHSGEETPDSQPLDGSDPKPLANAPPPFEKVRPMSRPSMSSPDSDVAALHARHRTAAPGHAPAAVARVRFALPRAAQVVAYVVDAAGQTVHTLCEAELEPGEHVCSWDGRDDAGRSFPAGTYTLKLEAANRLLCIRMVTLR